MREARMRVRTSALFAASLLVSTLVFATFASAKDKKSNIPAYVLSAHTVTVIIDPQAGVSLEDPQANRMAQKDVEAALLTWGRFQPLIGAPTADLIIVLRKGNGHFVDETVTDPQQNNRAGSITPMDGGLGAAAQHGPQPNTSAGGPPLPAAAHSQVEMGQPYDSFIVYEGGVDDPLDAPPGWRYMAKDGLHHSNVPAVDAFRKALAEADKAAAAAKKP
jgi:hypothetical protein